MGILKNRTDQQSLREAGRIASVVLAELMAACQPGVSTVTLEALANRLLQQHRSLAPFKSFEGFGHAICISLNEEIVNGLPSRDRLLAEEDVVSIAVGTCYRGIHGKAASTVYLGDEPSYEIAQLLAGTRAAIDRVVEASRSAVTLGAVLEVIPQTALEFGLTLILDGAGCGIGKTLHEPPWVPNNPEQLPEDVPLVPGLAFTLMPMMSLGSRNDIVLHEDGWTQMTTDGALSAHFADTVLMTDAGLEILTRH